MRPFRKVAKSRRSLGDLFLLSIGYAEKNGITVIKHYIDRAFSAKTDNRPEFQQMIKDSGKKLFDVVLVWTRTSAPLPVAKQTRNIC